MRAIQKGRKLLDAGQWIEIKLSFSVEDFNALKNLTFQQSMSVSSFAKQIISEYVAMRQIQVPGKEARAAT